MDYNKIRAPAFWAALLVAIGLACSQAPAIAADEDRPSGDAEPQTTDTSSGTNQVREVPEPGPAKPLFLRREAAEVLRLVKAGISEEVVLAYIERSKIEFALSPEQIIALREAGLSPRVLTEMLRHRGLPAPPGPPAPPELLSASIPGPPPIPVEVAYQDFYSALAPYGQWLNVPGLGWCWQPTVAARNSSWSPYVDNGYWMLSNYGWYWNSGYPWGWAPFHYGRWARRHETGWLWRPDTDWSPAWVCWRRGDGYLGWAPLPPQASFGRDSGWSFDGRPVGKDSEFGLASDDFVYTSLAHFTDQDWSRHRLSSDPAELFRGSASDNHYSFAAHGRVNNWGPMAQTIQQAGASIPRIQLIDRRLPIATPVSSSQLAQAQTSSSAPPASYSPAQTSFGENSGLQQPYGFGSNTGGQAWTGETPVLPSYPIVSGGFGGISGGFDWTGDSSDPTPGRGRWGSRHGGHHHDRPMNPTHNPGTPNPGAGAAPWLPVGVPSTPVGGEPFGVFGASRNPVAPGPPWGTFELTQPEPPLPNWPRNQEWQNGSRLGMSADNNFPSRSGNGLRDLALARSSHGTLGRGTLGRGVLGGNMMRPSDSTPTPWLATSVSYDSRLSGGPPYSPFGMANTPPPGSHAWGTFGVQPLHGNLPPYGVPGVPIIPNNGANPYLPFGQSIPSGGPPFGTAPYVPRGPVAMSGFTYLPGAPQLPRAPTLPTPPLLTLTRSRN